MLQMLAENIWTFRTSFTALGCDIGCRCNILRLSRGGLAIHSPLPLTRELKTSLTQLDSVQYIIAPNSHHHLYTAEFIEEFPDAQFWTVPQVVKKNPRLPTAHMLTEAEAQFIDNELFLEVVSGRPFFAEAVFLHVPTKTLILTDLISNMPRIQGFRGFLQSRLFGAGKGPKPGRFIKYALGSGSDTRRVVKTILNWDFERIVMAHGEAIEKDAKDILASAFSYLD